MAKQRSRKRGDAVRSRYSIGEDKEREACFRKRSGVILADQIVPIHPTDGASEVAAHRGANGREEGFFADLCEQSKSLSLSFTYPEFGEARLDARFVQGLVHFEGIGGGDATLVTGSAATTSQRVSVGAPFARPDAL